MHVDLSRGCSVLCLVNRLISMSLVEELLAAEMRASDRWWARLDLTGHEKDLPLNVLCVELNLPQPGSPAYDLRHFMLDVELPEIIVLVGLDQLTAGRDRWLRFIEQWADAAHSVHSTDYHPPAALLVILAPAPQETLPSENTMLHHHWWWSVPSGLEMTLLCRLRADESESLATSKLLWREAILPALAGNDFDLLDFLWDDVFGDFDVIIDRLLDFADQRGWTAQNLIDWGVMRVHHQRDLRRGIRSLNSIERALWSEGVLCHTPEFGTWTSVAALAVMEQYDAVRYRVWQGQASLVLPLVNKLRVVASQELMKRGTRRSMSGGGGRFALTDDSALEWTPLLAELRQMREPTIGNLISKVEHGRATRNTLAHYQLISYQDYARLDSYNL